jgi:hypothetical protein
VRHVGVTNPAVIAEEFHDLADSNDKLRVRIYAPTYLEETTWVCRVEVGSPINEISESFGEGSLQALSLGVRNLSARLYSHPLYREGKIGAFGKFGEDLGLPAPTSYFDFAPYPF